MTWVTGIQKLKEMYKDVKSDPESKTKDCQLMELTLTDVLIDYFEAHG